MSEYPYANPGAKYAYHDHPDHVDNPRRWKAADLDEGDHPITIQEISIGGGFTPDGYEEHIPYAYEP